MKIAVAVTGASGAIYAKVLLDTLTNYLTKDDSVLLMWSKNAKTVWEQELGSSDIPQYPFPVFDKDDFFAPIASGSSGYDALIVCPCSMGTLARIAQGISDDLISRAADVMMKERRKVVLVVRESPYNLIHLRNMVAVTEAGAVVFPASPSFYSLPQSFEALASTIIDRVLQYVGVQYPRYAWGSQKDDNYENNKR